MALLHLKKKLNNIDFINDGFGFQRNYSKTIEKKATYIEFNANALHRQTSNSITLKDLIKVLRVFIQNNLMFKSDYLIIAFFL